MPNRPSLVDIVFLQNVPDRMRGENRHAFDELIGVIGGAYRAEAAGSRLRAEPGELVHYPAGTAHRPLLDAGMAVRFYVLQWRAGDREPTFDRPAVVADPLGRLLFCLAWMWRLAPARDAADRGTLTRLLGLVLTELRRLRRPPAKPALGDAAVAATLRYMERDYHRPLGVAELARVAGLSVPQYLRRFRRALGTTPGRHLRDLRTEAAVKLLATTDLARAEVAARVGLRSLSHLHRLVKALTGRTPAELRGGRTV